jgi:hypothetical protein
MVLFSFLKYLLYKIKYLFEVDNDDWNLRIKKERSDLLNMAISYNIPIKDFVDFHQKYSCQNLYYLCF